ncbi:MAG: ABC transporter permease [Chloroflexi bacterium SZAS-1]|jgi:simple sugar transport system permease protein|nr:ABC transporter permease [Chloroflexi bacterium SZAS-1]HNP87247.1 ABC transporter permease [Kouleothrix sp.]
MSRNRFLFIMGTVIALILLTVVLGRNSDSPQIVAASMLATTLRFATPITLGALAGLFCERSGVVNIAIEGMMLAAAMGAFVGAAVTQSLGVGILAGILTGMIMGLLHAWLSITFKVDQIVSGTVINILAAGLTGFIDTQVLSKAGLRSAGLLPQIPIPILSDLPVVGPIFRQQPIAWTAIILVVVVHYVMFHTRWGLRTRAVGENPRAADTVGIRVKYMRYMNVLIGAGIAGLGGAYFTLEGVPSFETQITNGRGFIALAALIFGGWTSFGSWAAALLFGAANALQINAQQFGIPIPSQFVGMFPYLLTIVVLAGVIGRAYPPAAVGTPYETE